jgi:selenocysteine lyase/cysteine desulfurase
MGEAEAGSADVDARVHPGTVNIAAWLAAPAALDLHDAIGGAAKAARLRRLRSLWAEEARAFPGVEVLTPSDPGLHGAITSFRLAGRTSLAENVALARRLLEEDGVFTVHRGGVACGACVRVTPAPFTSEAEVLALLEGVRRLAASA